MKKALVTGGAGFIGSHITEELAAKGYQTTILDNFSTGREENISFLDNSVINVVRADVSDHESIEKYFKDVDYVFHMASLADIVPSIEKPMEYHRSNVDGTVAVLEAARKYKVKKVVYAASSSCYGLAKHFPTSENDIIDPQYPYALTKYIGEQYVMHWGRLYKMPVISLRLFNVFGPRSRTTGAYGAVFGVFLAQKLAGRKYTVVGDGNQTRDFIFVKDVANAFLTAAESNVSNEIFNIGTGKPQSINRLVELLKGDKTYIPKRPGEPDCTCADISKAVKTLKWKPEYTFEEGVKIMISNIECWKDAPVWTAESINDCTKEWFKYLD